MSDTDELCAVCTVTGNDVLLYGVYFGHVVACGEYGQTGGENRKQTQRLIKITAPKIKV